MRMPPSITAVTVGMAISRRRRERTRQFFRARRDPGLGPSAAADGRCWPLPDGSTSADGVPSADATGCAAADGWVADGARLPGSPRLSLTDGARLPLPAGTRVPASGAPRAFLFLMDSTARPPLTQGPAGADQY